MFTGQYIQERPVKLFISFKIKPLFLAFHRPRSDATNPASRPNYEIELILTLNQPQVNKFPANTVLGPCSSYSLNRIFEVIHYMQLTNACSISF